VDIELTAEQRQTLGEPNGRPVNLVDPQTQRSYVLVEHEEYERLEALRAKEPERSSVLDTSDVPPGIRASQEAYWKDLPELLQRKSKKRQWLAYHREQRVGFAATVAELYQKCAQLGIPNCEFYVDRAESRELPPWAVEEIRVHAGGHPHEQNLPAMRQELPVGRQYET
jgi:hypothetical protein